MVYNHGMWRSLVAHTHGVRGVAGSNPVIPTFFKNKNDTLTQAHPNEIGRVAGLHLAKRSHDQIDIKTSTINGNLVLIAVFFSILLTPNVTCSSLYKSTLPNA